MTSAPPLKERVDAVLAKGLTPSLKDTGFRKAGRTYRRAFENHTCIVAVHGGTGSKPNRWGHVGHYSIELGVFFPDAYAVSRAQLKRQPGIHECYVAAGLPASGWGYFDDFRDDIPSTDEQAAALEKDWAAFGPHWFAEYSKPHRALDFALENEDWEHAFYLGLWMQDWPCARLALEAHQKMFGGEARVFIDAIAARYPALQE